VHTRRFLPVGFTLIELLVVISIIAVLIAILLPALGAARDLAIMSKCATQQKQLITASANYTSDFDGYWPHCGDTDLPHRVGEDGVKLNEILFEAYFLSLRETAFCPGRIFEVRNPDTTEFDYFTEFITYQYHNFRGKTWDFQPPDLRHIENPGRYALWSCLTIDRQNGNYLAHDHPFEPGPLTGLNAAWTDGSAGWVNGEDAEHYVIADGGHYMWPTPPQ